MEFVGRLSAFPMAEILQWVLNDRRTGVLLVRSGEREKWVSFRRGQVVACVAEKPEELYSRFLLVNGYTDPQTLVGALGLARREGERLGWALVELGVMSEEEVRKTLTQHVSDAVCGLFLWTEGSFYFESHEVEEEPLMPEAIETMGLIMEGTRWTDEYQRICAVFVHEHVLLGRGPRWPGDDLDPVGRRVVAAMGQKETLSELYGEVKGSYFRFLETAYRLVQQGVLEIGGWTMRPDGTVPEPLRRSGSRDELSVEATPLLSQSNLEMLVTTIPRLVPYWVRQPAAADNSELRRLLADADGRTTIAELCKGDPAERHARLTMLLHQVRSGNLALLPAPADSLRGREA